MSFLVKAEAVKGPLGWLLINVGQYALLRGVPDREPLLKALAQLQAGGAIGIFPEGTRGAGTVATVFPGAGWLAARSGAAVVPVAIRGTNRPAGRAAPVPARGRRAGRGTVPGRAGRRPQGRRRRHRAIRVHLAALVATLDAEIADRQLGVTIASRTKT